MNVPIFIKNVMRKIVLYILGLVVCCQYIVSCDDSDSFTTDRASLLSFSTDTVKFDTVISTIGSSTRQLMVYNYNPDGIRIVTARMPS